MYIIMRKWNLVNIWGEKMKNTTIKSYLIKAAFLLTTLILGISIGIFGMNQYVKKQKEAEQKNSAGLITDKIAIVNLDNGVMVEDENVNYAGKLLTDLEDNFLFTGLEDARAGYESGMYAGYLIIPATFSEGVVSLNDTPVRAEITYAINENLTAEAKEQAIYDVMGFMTDLNDKISYMYMHSMMDEFHDAQDETDTVMENDLAEKEAINAIEAEDLVALAPVTEVTEIENTIEPVDVSDYITKNVELTADVGTKYQEFIAESETEHLALNEAAAALLTEMGNMDPLITGIDFMTDEEGNSIYQEGKDELSTFFSTHNTTLETKELEIQNNVLTMYGDIQIFYKEYERLKNEYQSATGLTFDDYVMDEEGNPKVDETGNTISLSNMFNKYNVDLADEEVKKTVLDQQVGQIERMELTALETVVEEKILTPVQNKADTTTQAIADQYAIEKEQLGEYSTAVTEYDPLEYIDDEAILEITTAMQENGTELAEAIAETDLQQMEYVAEVYETTRDDLTNMQSVIEQAKEDSDQAVADGLANLQTVKNENSKLNQEIMLDFSQKLPYTRLGSMEYTQAYEFIANPVSYRQMEETTLAVSKEDSVKTESDSVSVNENRQKDYQMLGMIICAMICVIIVGSTIKYHFHKEEIVFEK